MIHLNEFIEAIVYAGEMSLPPHYQSVSLDQIDINLDTRQKSRTSRRCSAYSLFVKSLNLDTTTAKQKWKQLSLYTKVHWAELATQHNARLLSR